MDRRQAVLAVSVLLSACATPEQSLKAPMRGAMPSIGACVLVPQTGLDVTVSATDGGQGGLLGVLVAAAIDSKRQTMAEARSGLILAALQGYDFRQTMTGALAQESEQRTALPLRKPWTLATTDSPSHRRGLYNDAAESAVLLFAVRYRLESGNLLVTGDALLYPKGGELARFRPKADENDPLAEGNAVYRKNFVFKRENLQADAAVSALNEAAASLASQLLADLQRDY